MRKRLHKGKCKTTGKRKYASSLDCLLDHMTNPRRIRAYECPFCGFHHATSKPLREAA